MSMRTLQAESRSSHYCARCQHEVGVRDESCANCTTPFTGCGRFDRIEGTPPATPFRGMFRRQNEEVPLLAA